MAPAWNDEPEWLSVSEYSPDRIYYLCEQWVDEWIALFNCLTGTERDSIANRFDESTECLATIAEFYGIDAGPLVQLQSDVSQGVFHGEFPLPHPRCLSAATIVVERIKIKAQAAISKNFARKRNCADGHSPSATTSPAAETKPSEVNGGDVVVSKPRKRKRKTDPKAKEKRAVRQEQQKTDKRLSEAWAGGMGQYKTKAELAKEKNMKEKDVVKALDRHRKKLERAGKKRTGRIPQ